MLRRSALCSTTCAVKGKRRIGSRITTITGMPILSPSPSPSAPVAASSCLLAGIPVVNVHEQRRCFTSLRTLFSSSTARSKSYQKICSASNKEEVGPLPTDSIPVDAERRFVVPGSRTATASDETQCRMEGPQTHAAEDNTLSRLPWRSAAIGRLGRASIGVGISAENQTFPLDLCQKRFFGKAREVSRPPGPIGGNSRSQSARPRAVSPPMPTVTNWEVAKMIALNLWPENRWDLRIRVLLSFACVVITKSLKICVPFWFKSVVDSLVPATAATGGAVTVGPITLGVFGMIAAYGLTRICVTFTDEFKRVLFAPVNNNATNTIGLQIFRKLHKMDLSFHLSKQTGSLARDLDRGSRAFSAITFDVFFSLSPTVIEMTLVCYMLYMYAGTQFVAVALSAVAAYFVWTLNITTWRTRFRQEYNEADTRLGGLIIDSLVNYETVKYFNSEEFEAKRAESHYLEINEKMLKVEGSLALLNMGQHFVFIMAATTGFYLGAAAVLAGTMSVGDMVMVDALLLQMYQPLQFLGMIYRELTASTLNMDKMLGLLKAKELVEDQPNTLPIEFKKGDLELENVTFGYLKQRRILENVSLKIPGGSTVAFVGPSGSGKTTIFRLFFRFFDPDEGQVLLDGQDIKKVSLASLRQQFGVIPQDTVMFNDTIRHNIAYGRTGATDEEIEEAAEASEFHKSVAKFPQRYNTMVGERGLMLSGGEKQRLAIARVFLKGSPILLADEATSALDTKTESNVMQMLNTEDKLGRKRTLIMIAHRLSTVQNADQIFVLNGKGGLAESGTHQELLAAKGLYHQLWTRQRREAELEDLLDIPPEP